MTGLERHWYRISPLHLFLYPASLLFRLLASLRRLLYRTGLLKSERLPVPVVVVGNITVGGTGKTPLILALARELVQRGHHPVIVSRGYLGSSQHVRAVSADSTAGEVGDEPLLMARRNLCPVWIGRNRAAAARAALAAHPECSVVLCDDGLQHYRLQRDVEIAVVDGARGLGNGLLLPAGPLREPASRLDSVDAVVVNGGKTRDGHYGMRLEGHLFHNLLAPEHIVDAEHFGRMRNHAVAGIGNPQRYFRHLEELGLVFAPHAFPDHHPYRAEDLAFDDCDAILLTEKDAVKCAAFADARYWVLRVEAQTDPALLDRVHQIIDTSSPKIDTSRKTAPDGR